MTPTYTTIDEYILACPTEAKTMLTDMRKAICQAAPQALEKISWGMATFVLNGNLVHFSAAKNHVGFHPAPSAIEHFSKELAEYKTSKGTVQFPFNKPLPLELIYKMVTFRVAEQASLAAAKNAPRQLNKRTYKFKAEIKKVPDIDGAYVEFPYDVRQEFVVGRVKVHATFDGEPYDGSLVRMQTEGHIIGIRKDLRAKIGKQAGDEIEVTIKERK